MSQTAELCPLETDHDQGEKEPSPPALTLRAEVLAMQEHLFPLSFLVRRGPPLTMGVLSPREQVRVS